MDDFEGQKIKAIRPMTKKELKTEYWEEDNFSTPVVIELENGAKLYASQDSEGNGPGAMFARDAKGNSLLLAFARRK